MSERTLEKIHGNPDLELIAIERVPGNTPEETIYELCYESKGDDAILGIRISTVRDGVAQLGLLSHKYFPDREEVN